MPRLVPRLLGGTTKREHPELVRAVAAMAAGMPLAGMVGALRAMRDRADATPLLAHIRVPTLVLCGSDDEISPASAMRAMAERIGGARYVEVADAGHLAPLERPEEVNRAFVEFLLHPSLG